MAMVGPGSYGPAAVAGLLLDDGDGPGDIFTGIMLQFSLPSGVIAQVDGPLRSTTTGHSPLETLPSSSGISAVPHRCCLCKAVTVV